jgi:myo-inositol-1(or 4)-monophosphatase
VPLTDAEPITDAELAIAAAEAGAAAVRARFGTPLDRIDKEPGDFATAADIEAESAILAVIRAARPDDGVVGEELGTTPGAGDRTWLVDPLCGTVNFAARTMLVAVNVALRIGSGMTAAVTTAASADPFAGEVFWTEGQHAYVRRDGLDERLTPSSATGLVEVNLDPTFRAPGMLVDPAFRQRFRPRVLSTTLPVAWVAAGRRAGYVSDGDLRDSVHFAAGLALCWAAGCVVTGIDGQPLHTGEGGLIAADRETHAALLAAIRHHTVYSGGL